MPFIRQDLSINPNLGRSGSRIPVRQSIDRQRRNTQISGLSFVHNEVISSGCESLDKLLLKHNGVPLDSFILFEEQGSTDFASLMLRLYAAQGLFQSPTNTGFMSETVIGVGVDYEYTDGLPAPEGGNLQKQDHNQIITDSFNGNANNGPATTEINKLRIAWRYQNNRSSLNSTRNQVSSNYCATFDISKHDSPDLLYNRFIPISFIDETTIETIRNHIKSIKQENGNERENELIRIVIPSFLSPLCYSSSFFEDRGKPILKFLHSLGELTREFPNTITVFISISTMYVQSTGLLPFIEKLMDGIIELVPFNSISDISDVKSAAKNFTNEAGKELKGIANIKKLPILTQRGSMCVHKYEYAFRVSRKCFEFENWSIPVDDE